MTERLARYRRRRRGEPFPLAALHRRLRAGDGAGAAELGAELDLPSAAVRAVRSYYSQLGAAPATEVCVGTSCRLAGAGGLAASLAAAGRGRRVHCLGRCDRSPAVRRADGSVVTDAFIGPRGALSGEPGGEEEVRTEVRCLAPEPIVTRNLGDGGAAELGEARRRGVWRALALSLERDPGSVLAELEASGERGRGGAGFPTAAKWRMCAGQPGKTRYVVANGDEGDPGSFVDRLLMTLDPHSVLEGMALAGLAVGAREGIVFVRGEYPHAARRLERAAEEARQAGLLGRDVLGSGFDFEVTVFRGLGSYVCGEETALLEALEGRRGEVRLRPPYPVEAGLHGRPTVVNNVETLAAVPWIVARGGGAYRALGTRSSAGTKALCLNAGFARPGLVEVEMGTPLRRVLEEEGGGGREGRRLAMVLVGGPMGSVVPEAAWDVPVCYGAMAERGLVLGHGGLVAVSGEADLGDLLEGWVAFVQSESCGKCVPCSLGSARVLERLRAGPDPADREPILRWLELMSEASLCAFGQLTAAPLRTLVTRYGDRVFAEGRR